MHPYHIYTPSPIHRGRPRSNGGKMSRIIIKISKGLLPPPLRNSLAESDYTCSQPHQSLSPFSRSLYLAFSSWDHFIISPNCVCPRTRQYSLEREKTIKISHTIWPSISMKINGGVNFLCNNISTWALHAFLFSSHCHAVSPVISLLSRTSFTVHYPSNLTSVCPALTVHLLRHRHPSSHTKNTAI